MMKICTMIEKKTIYKGQAGKIMEQEWNNYNQEWKEIHTMVWVRNYNLSQIMIHVRRKKYKKRWNNPRQSIIQIHMHRLRRQWTWCLRRYMKIKESILWWKGYDINDKGIQKVIPLNPDELTDAGRR